MFFTAVSNAIQFSAVHFQISSRGNDTADWTDPDTMELPNAEIQSLLDDFECPGRTVQGILDTIEEGQHVVDYFYFGPNGPDGLMPEVFERYEYIVNMVRTRWWIENCAVCGAPDNTFMGKEVHLYGLTKKQIECYVRCGTPFPPDFISRMDDDDFDHVGQKNTIQTDRLLAWKEGAREEFRVSLNPNPTRREPPPPIIHACGNAVCANPGTKKCARCGVLRYCGKECQAKHWKEGHKQECLSLRQGTSG